MTNERIKALESNFRNFVQNDRKIANAFLLVHSDKHGIHVNLAEGMTGEIKTTSNQPYFTASVGKLFTAVLVAILVERGKLDYEDPIERYLDDAILENLHIYKDTDYTKEIKVRHLLNHTSGVHDFFEDKPKEGKPLLDLILDEPDRIWTPQETIQWSKEHLTAHFPPGEGFHYSDTGYHLLGLIVENVTSKPFHKALKKYIFKPLRMNSTFVLQHSEPIQKNDYPIADVYFKDTNISHYKSLSVDYAGGGITAPSKDLLKFMKALVNHEIISEASLETMQDWAKFAPGIEYGYGIMKFKPTTIVLPKKYAMWGNAGITGSFMFYHPELETYIIGSLNQFYYHRKGIKLVFKIVDEMMK